MQISASIVPHITLHTRQPRHHSLRNSVVREIYAYVCLLMYACSSPPTHTHAYLFSCVCMLARRGCAAVRCASIWFFTVGF